MYNFLLTDFFCPSFFVPKIGHFHCLFRPNTKEGGRHLYKVGEKVMKKQTMVVLMALCMVSRSINVLAADEQSEGIPETAIVTETDAEAESEVEVQDEQDQMIPAESDTTTEDTEVETDITVEADANAETEPSIEADAETELSVEADTDVDADAESEHSDKADADEELSTEAADDLSDEISDEIILDSVEDCDDEIATVQEIAEETETESEEDEIEESEEDHTVRQTVPASDSNLQETQRGTDYSSVKAPDEIYYNPETDEYVLEIELLSNTKNLYLFFPNELQGEGAEYFTEARSRMSFQNPGTGIEAKISFTFTREDFEKILNGDGVLYISTNSDAGPTVTEITLRSLLSGNYRPENRPEETTPEETTPEETTPEETTPEETTPEETTPEETTPEETTPEETTPEETTPEEITPEEEITPVVEISAEPVQTVTDVTVAGLREVKEEEEDDIVVLGDSMSRLHVKTSDEPIAMDAILLLLSAAGIIVLAAKGKSGCR